MSEPICVCAHEIEAKRWPCPVHHPEHFPPGRFPPVPEVRREEGANIDCLPEPCRSRMRLLVDDEWMRRHLANDPEEPSEFTPTPSEDRREEEGRLHPLLPPLNEMRNMTREEREEFDAMSPPLKPINRPPVAEDEQGAGEDSEEARAAAVRDVFAAYREAFLQIVQPPAPPSGDEGEDYTLTPQENAALNRCVVNVSPYTTELFPDTQEEATRAFRKLSAAAARLSAAESRLAQADAALEIILDSYADPNAGATELYAACEQALTILGRRQP